jgi:hypothetical protein
MSETNSEGELPSWVNDFLNRRTKVENFLMLAGIGKGPLPDQAKCRELALLLGNPSE